MIMENDVPMLMALQHRLHGRVARPLRNQRARALSITVRRDPRDVSYRFLRRFLGGNWYRGGSHVARYNGGPGIGFPGWVNDQAVKIKAITI